jgi:hypothetical protein
MDLTEFRSTGFLVGKVFAIVAPEENTLGAVRAYRGFFVVNKQ